MNYDLQELNSKKNTLQKVREELKTEFFGIDDQIDQLIDSIRTWYLMPELIKYPVIVNLWSMTGSGKTALVRSLAHKLGKSNQYVEIMPNHFKVSPELYTLFSNREISPKENNIIFFDEFQKFNSKDSDGKDDNKENESLWNFLSEGRVARPKFSMPWQFDANLFVFDQETLSVGDSKRKGISLGRLRKSATGVQINDVLKLVDFSISREQGLSMSVEECHDYILKFQETAPPSIDYSKSLIIIAGNLDEVFPSSNSLSDCDTEADSYRKITEKISMIEVREALGERFKPEHISRLGNNHIIYPSLSKDAYRKIIRNFSQKYLSDIKETSGIDFSLSESVVGCIYDNSVYPTQGTRPVFSSIHKIFGSSLSNAVIWALENDVNSAEVSLDAEKSELVFESPSSKKRLQLPVILDIKDRKARYSDDYTSLIAVHEMGHAILYSHFFQTPPEEIKINVASYTGGYNLYPSRSENKESILMRICVGYGGIIAEELVFGEGQRSTGSESDIAKITQLASNYVRRWGFNGIEARQDIPGMNGAVTFTDVKQSDSHIEGILQVQKARAKEILTKNRNLLVELSKKLFDAKSLTRDQYVAMCAGAFEFKETSDKVDIFGDYHSKLFQGQGF